MKILGLIGGISWVSTVEYYTQINKGINKQLGDVNFSECIIYSLNFQNIKDNLDISNWEPITEIVVSACKKLEQNGAEGIILCANTMHYIADKIEDEINIPIIHIALSTGKEIQKVGLKKVGLLGTKFTMNAEFFKSKLRELGIETITPTNSEDIEFVHDTILNELGKGIVKEETRERYLEIIEQLKNEGAEGFIAGCTEIPLIIKESDIDFPYFDTAQIHSKYAVEFALND